MIKIVQGDITTLAVDAIVNAAKIAVGEVGDFLTQRREVAEGAEMEVVFCCFSERDKMVYESIV